MLAFAEAAEVPSAQVPAIVLIRKGPTAKERNAHRQEIIGADQVHLHRGALVRWGLRPTLDDEGRLPVISAQGQTRGDTDRLDARQYAKPLDQTLVETDLRIFGFIFLFRQIEAETQDAFVGEPRLDLLQTVKAPQQQPGASQHHQGQRHLRDHQSLAQPGPPAGRTARRVLESVMQFGPTGLPRRGQSEEYAGQQGDPGRERQYDGIEADLRRAWNGVAAHGQNQTHAAPGKQQPKRAAHDGQEHTLGEQLPDDPPSARPQRRAHGQFLLSRGATREQEIGHVRTRD